MTPWWRPLAFSFPPPFLPVLAGLLSRRLSAHGALAGFFAGLGAASLFWGYTWFSKPANLSRFQAVSIIVPTLVTVLVLMGAARWFPATGEAAERVSRFFTRLGEPVLATPDPAENPAPIAGLVTLTMGLILVVVGSGVLATAANKLTLGTGIFLALVGASMMGARFWPRLWRSRPATSSGQSG